MSPNTLARKISSFAARPPITTDFESKLQVEGRWSRTGFWYGSQKQHWRGWLSGYHGPGFYKRKKWGRDAKYAYNHLLCPPIVLWLAEASGVPKQTVMRAMKSALSASPSLASQCAAIRKVVPWEILEKRLSKLAQRQSSQG